MAAAECFVGAAVHMSTPYYQSKLNNHTVCHLWFAISPPRRSQDVLGVLLNTQVRTASGKESRIDSDCISKVLILSTAATQESERSSLDIVVKSSFKKPICSATARFCCFCRASFEDIESVTFAAASLMSPEGAQADLNCRRMPYVGWLQRT